MTLTTPTEKNILIIGVDSQIGHALSVYLHAIGIPCVGTSRKKQHISQNIYFFDFADPDFNVFDQRFSHAIICAGVTNIAECESDPIGCKQINVIHTTALIDILNRNGTFVIYLSSNAVFNGNKPFYRYDDVTSPETKYGAYKCEVEDYLAANSPENNCVLRLTKVISITTPFIERWHQQAKAGQAITAFTNRFVSPIDINEVIRTIHRLIEIKPRGLFQLGNQKEYSYYQYAQVLFQDRPDMLDLLVPTEDPLSVEKQSYNSLHTFLPD